MVIKNVCFVQYLEVILFVYSKYWFDNDDTLYLPFSLVVTFFNVVKIYLWISFLCMRGQTIWRVCGTHLVWSKRNNQQNLYGDSTFLPYLPKTNAYLTERSVQYIVITCLYTGMPMLRSMM